MVIVFLVFPAVGSVAAPGFLASLAACTDEDEMRVRKVRSEESEDGGVGQGGERGNGVVRADGVNGSASVVNASSSGYDQYGYGVAFGGIFVLQKLAECTFVSCVSLFYTNISD